MCHLFSGVVKRVLPRGQSQLVQLEKNPCGLLVPVNCGGSELDITIFLMSDTTKDHNYREHH